MYLPGNPVYQISRTLKSSKGIMATTVGPDCDINCLVEYWWVEVDRYTVDVQCSVELDREYDEENLKLDLAEALRDRIDYNIKELTINSNPLNSN